MKLREKDILIIEGLHALNNELTKTIDASKKYKMYLSPLTSINIDNHNRISTSDNRIIRRMVEIINIEGIQLLILLLNGRMLGVEKKGSFSHIKMRLMLYLIHLWYMKWVF